MSEIKPMYILLDTNIYFNNWFLKGPLFAKLSHYCREKEATLLVPEVVVDEVQAKFQEGTEKALKMLKEAHRACENVGHTEVPTAESLPTVSYDFRRVVKEAIPNVIFFPYDAVPHRLLVAKAIGAKRPFTESEKGYRDALIWHSLLDFLGSDRFEVSVAFVSQNSSDFFEGNSTPIRFHPDLLFDLRSAGVKNRLIPFQSLREFIDANKILTSEGIDRERLTAEFSSTIESAAEDAAIEYLNGLPAVAVQRLFANAGFNSQAVPFLLAANWEILEGTEDPQILSAELLEKDKVYVSYDFNLRSVISQWTIRGADFFHNRQVFDSAFLNARGDDEFMHLETHARCFFKASFIVNLACGEVMESSIDSSWLGDYRS